MKDAIPTGRSRRAACWRAFASTTILARYFGVNRACGGADELESGVRRWWRDHDVRERSSGEKVTRRPRLGTIMMTCATFQWTRASGFVMRVGMNNAA
jgi:hypothetical protein